ncbi:hypothetical protein Sjap_010821 [Stephania japonica]|uniref:Uncharacterized protein n=1 Tax=Stephania japonica TaxID=461633 RepID=A0AAP0JA36_9MAGN
MVKKQSVYPRYVKLSLSIHQYMLVSYDLCESVSSYGRERNVRENCGTLEQRLVLCWVSLKCRGPMCIIGSPITLLILNENDEDEDHRFHVRENNSSIEFMDEFSQPGGSDTNKSLCKIKIFLFIR